MNNNYIKSTLRNKNKAKISLRLEHEREEPSDYVLFYLGMTIKDLAIFD
jgi:hypothetical protein